MRFSAWPRANYPPVDNEAYREGVVHAAALVGGAQASSERLHVPMDQLGRWMRGEEQPPVVIYLDIIHIMLAESRKSRSHPSKDADLD